MDIARSSFVNSVATGLEGMTFRSSAATLARRARLRRWNQAMIGLGYLIGAAILQLYANAGTIPMAVGPAYAISGLALMGFAILLSEFGFNERFSDHYLIAPLSAANMVVLLVFTYLAPQVGVLFLCSLFTLFSFFSLRTTPGQAAAIWAAMTLGMAALFLFTDKPIAMPHDSHLERFATMTVFVLTIGRCMLLGISSAAMKRSLYESRQKLREAYQRITELAELDELTGSFNRRCIMRMLDEEIARSGRTGRPCSIALIDLDWFKRINDAFGHPAGDEVLRTFAITVFANVRSIDRFGRYGGEEFLLILPEMASEGAVRALDRLRMIVADLDWSALSPGMVVTLSAGVATLKGDETSDSLLARADRALYAAKARGRDCIACA